MVGYSKDWDRRITQPEGKRTGSGQRGRTFAIICFLPYFPFPHRSTSSALSVFTVEDWSVKLLHNTLFSAVCFLQVLPHWCTYAKCLELSDKNGLQGFMNFRR